MNINNCSFVLTIRQCILSMYKIVASYVVPVPAPYVAYLSRIFISEVIIICLNKAVTSGRTKKKKSIKSSWLQRENLKICVKLRQWQISLQSLVMAWTICFCRRRRHLSDKSGDITSTYDQLGNLEVEKSQWIPKSWPVLKI